MSAQAESSIVFPPVSVVIAAYTDERWSLICDAVESVRSQTAPVLETVLFVDHNPELLARTRREFTDCTVIANTGSRGASPSPPSDSRPARQLESGWPTRVTHLPFGTTRART